MPPRHHVTHQSGNEMKAKQPPINPIGGPQLINLLQDIIVRGPHQEASMCENF